MKKQRKTIKEIGDIFPVILRHNAFYEERLKDLVQQDTIPTYFRDDKNNAQIWIEFGHILATSKWWCPWEKLEVKCKNPKEYLLNLLDKLELKRFFDEDNMGGLFIKGDEAWCLVNPDFPNGYWENHTLDKFRPNEDL